LNQVLLVPLVIEFMKVAIIMAAMELVGVSLYLGLILSGAMFPKD